MTPKEINDLKKEHNRLLDEGQKGVRQGHGDTQAMP